MMDPVKAFTIRPATEEDMPDMLEILSHANMHHIPSPEMPELDWTCCFVAESENRVVGMSGYKVLSATEAETTLMAVAPDFRRLRVGYALQTRRLEELAKKGIQTLTTYTDRPENISWYKRHFGYREIGRLAKEHEFGDPDIDHWTTLIMDLKTWKRHHEPEA